VKSRIAKPLKAILCKLASWRRPPSVARESIAAPDRNVVATSMLCKEAVPALVGGVIVGEIDGAQGRGPPVFVARVESIKRQRGHPILKL
jgi:hypothetical protein